MPRISAEALRLAGYELRDGVFVKSVTRRTGRGRPHKSELEAIRAATRAVGGEAWVLHQVGRLRGSSGLPDAFLTFPRVGKAIWFEVKVPGDRLRPAQWAFIEAAARCGQGVLVGDARVLIGWMARVGLVTE